MAGFSLNIGYIFFIAYLFYSFVESFLYLNTGWASVKYIDDLLFFVVLFDFCMSKKVTVIRYPKIFIYTAICLFLYIFWGIFNGNVLFVIVQNLREYQFIFILPFYLAYLPQIQYCNFFLKIMLWLSIPVSIVQRIVSTNVTGDDVIGLFGSSGILSTIIVVYFFVEYSNRVISKNKVFGLYWLLLIPMLINETKYHMALFGFLLMTPWILLKPVKVESVFFSIVLSILGSTILSMMLNKLYDIDFFQMLSLDFLSDYLVMDTGEDLGRGLKFMFALDKISVDLVHFLFGYGFGSCYSGFDNGMFGVISESYRNTLMFKGTIPQAFIYLIDFGVLGVLMIIFSVIYLLYKALKFSTQDDGFLFVNMFMLLCSLPYNNFISAKEYVAVVMISLSIYYSKSGVKNANF